jgi:arylsulfatase A-like enzyme
MKSNYLRKAITLTLAAGVGQMAMAQDMLPQPEPKFQGKIGLTYKDSLPDFPKMVEAPKGAPNVLMIVIDDVGYGQFGTFGGKVTTPGLDKVARSGLRYTQFHTTALSSPTRAALLTGRNHHTCGTGVIMEIGTGYPGYDTMLPKSCATVAEILKQNGYNTAAFGKWHNTPDWETSRCGPFDRWPTGVGFEYFFGFQGAECNELNPELYENVTPYTKTPEEEKQHMTEIMTERAITWMRNQKTISGTKPFFLYFATGATHCPHQVPDEWRDKFKGQFNMGWDKYREETFKRQKKLGVIPANAKLTARPKEIPAWDSLSADQKRLYSRMMELYAAYTAHTDYNVSKLLAALKELGLGDNTLIVYVVGDNGGSGEGGLGGLTNEMSYYNTYPDDDAYNLKNIDKLGTVQTFNHYPVGWAWAMNTPFKWTKQIASHLGGIRNGLVISYPKKIKDKGGVRSQFHHCIDIAPTILEIVKVDQPSMVNGVAQKPMEGVSMVYTFDQPRAKSKRTTQYFEILANRGIYHDGWFASCMRAVPWDSVRKPVDLNALPWELYNLEKDFTQSENLADKNPEKLKELQDLFWAEAARYNVLPLDDRGATRVLLGHRPSLTEGRMTFVYYPGMTRLTEGSAPDVKNRSFSVTAVADIPQEGSEGVIVAQGGRFAGWSMYLLDGKLNFTHNWIQREHYTVTSRDKVPSGKVTMRVDFDYDGGDAGKGGTAKLFINNRPVGQARVERTVSIRFSPDETFDVGEDTGTPVIDTYQSPFKFTGNLEKVTVHLKPYDLRLKMKFYEMMKRQG